MKPEEIALLSIVVSGLMSSITLILGRVLSKRVDLAGAKSQEGDAAIALSNAARIQIETYNKEVVAPIRASNDRLESHMADLVARNQEIEKSAQDDRERNRVMIAGLQDEIAHIKAEVRRADDSLEYLIGVTKGTYPNEVEVAYKIRRGELHM